MLSLTRPLQRAVRRRACPACEDEQYESKHSNYIRDVEYSRPQATESEVEEVSDATIELKPVNQIADAAGSQEGEAGNLYGSSSGTACSYPKQSEDDEANGALEERHSRGGRKTRANAKKSTDILDTDYSKGVPEVHVAFTQSELCASYILRDLVAPNAPEQKCSNQCQTPDISQRFHMLSNG